MIELLEKMTLDETTDQGPALADWGYGLFLAWKGAGNDKLNIAFQGSSSELSFPPENKLTIGYGYSSDRGPALAAHPAAVGRPHALYMAWKGAGNENINVARLDTDPGVIHAGLVGRDFANKQTFPHTTDQRPAIASSRGLLYLAWKGSGNDNLNVAFSEDDGSTFPAMNMATYEDSSDRSPVLAPGQYGNPLLAWKGSGNDNMAVAAVPLFPGGRGAGLDNKHILGDTTDEGPALASLGKLLFLAWKGSGNDNLNVAFSQDNGATFAGDAIAETSDRSPALASIGDRLYMAWKGSGNQNINVARLSGWSHAGPLPPPDETHTHLGPLPPPDKTHLGPLPRP